jgi:hypothetical protein
MIRSPITPLFPFLLLAAAAVCQGPAPAFDVEQVRRQANDAVQAGDFDTAAAGFRRITDANPQDGQAMHMLGYSLHAAGKLDEALSIHERAAALPGVGASSAYNAGCALALKGRTDEAFRWLGKAIELGFDDVKLLAEDSDLASLRADARFTDLAKKVKAKAAASPGQAFAQRTDRCSSRVVWFGRGGSPGQIAIDYTPVAWNERYETLIADGKAKGKKWRLGADFWTTLDTSIPLRFGQVQVPPGYYYLTLEQRTAESYVLALHDPVEVRKLKVDPVFAGQLKGGIEVTMTHGETEDVADHLEVTIATTTSPTEGALTVRYGGHRLNAPVAMQFE